MPFLKVSWRTWRPLGSMVARCSPVLLEKSKAIRRPLGDQSESWLGVWVSRCWCVPSGLAAQILKSPSLGSNRVKVIRPLAGRCPGWCPPAAAGAALPSTARAMARAISGSLVRISASPQTRRLCVGHRGLVSLSSPLLPATRILTGQTRANAPLRCRSRSRPVQETVFSRCRLWTGSAGPGAGLVMAVTPIAGRRSGRSLTGVGWFRCIVISSVVWPGFVNIEHAMPIAATDARRGTSGLA